MVYDNKRIAKAYLKGWFTIDFITCLPLDMIVLSAMDATGESGSGDYTLLRLLRMLRIMKLARIVRAARIFNRWQDHISISFATLSLFKFTFLTVVLAHWLACLWGFVGEPHDDEWISFDQGLTWRQKARMGESAGPFALYGASLYVAFNNIFGGSSEIHPANYVEFYVQVGMMVLGSSVWAYVIGSACGIVATLDPARSLTLTRDPDPDPDPDPDSDPDPDPDPATTLPRPASSTVRRSTSSTTSAIRTICRTR